MYAKIFSQVFDSSIADDWQVRVVFQDLLILADSEGYVDMTQTAIAARTRIPLDIVNHALTALLTPDPHSRSREEEGRRIVSIDPERGWGWRIVNYQKYRNMKTDIDRKTYMRNYMRNKRQSPVNSLLTPKLTSVNIVNTSHSVSSSVSSLEGESMREETRKRFVPPSFEECQLHAAKIGLSDIECQKFFNHFESNGWKVGGKAPMKKWQSSMNNWKLNVAQFSRPAPSPGSVPNCCR